jgi:hypothetical protein
MVLYLPLVEYMEHEYTSNELLWSSSSEELLCFTYLYLQKKINKENISILWRF